MSLYIIVLLSALTATLLVLVPTMLDKDSEF
jgi:hypothetical protein